MHEDIIKALIFERLCQERKQGNKAVLDAETLRRDLKLTEDPAFGKVLESLVSDGGGIYINANKQTKDVWLGTGGQLACDQGRNPFRAS